MFVNFIFRHVHSANTYTISIATFQHITPFIVLSTEDERCHKHNCLLPFLSLIYLYFYNYPILLQLILSNSQLYIPAFVRSLLTVPRLHLSIHLNSLSHSSCFLYFDLSFLTVLAYDPKTGADSSATGSRKLYKFLLTALDWKCHRSLLIRVRLQHFVPAHGM